ncbi:glycosyl hydrolase 115 family protein [Pedobacter cryophilus]|nr:glycosyl hydrolase 115 family protein [Pedobacter cryophilus]
MIKYLYQKILVLFIIGLLICINTYAADNKEMVSIKAKKGSFPLVKNGVKTVFYIDKQNQKGVDKAIHDLINDIKLVSNINAESVTEIGNNKQLIIVGTIGESKLIDDLIASKKLDISAIKNTWENHLITVVKNPFPNVKNALIIAGSDKRGTIYGVYSLSEKIGVSPWYYWADVPVKKKSEIFINAGIYSDGSPKVKYRGIFLNDEAPALSGWSKEKFGGFNSKFYDKVFELILRLKGNYLWPAMWGSAFYDDDPKNAILANEYGVVIGTSHHEPLMRAHDEWRRYGNGGAWNYNTNPDGLKKFWTDGIQRMGNNESIISVGMRGDGDEPMSRESNTALLEKIVNDQREIIATVTGKKANETPQLWALYKEVQDYYDKGMRVPDDVTLLLCDDNWGNIRKLPTLDSPERSGGFGVYYHFDYVGGPRNYKWINTNPLPRIWEQMNLAYEYKANQIWIVNVGDLKPMEYPISFFLDFAWNPEKWKANQLDDYAKDWATKQFGAAYAKEIASLMSNYSKYNSRRKPELLDQRTYSLHKNREFELVVKDYNNLLESAKVLAQKLSSEYQDAYYQLVLHPIEASSNLNNLYYAVAKNHLYTEQNRISANAEAEKAKQFYKRDQEITEYYNKTLANGKWNHMMDQTHISYTSWQQPEANKIPELKTVNPKNEATLALAIEGSKSVWPQSKERAVLPEFIKQNESKHYIDLFNQGTGTVNFEIKENESWVKLSQKSGTFNDETRVWLNIDWAKVPEGSLLTPIKIVGTNNFEATIYLKVVNLKKDIKGFIPQDEVIAIDAANFTSNNSAANVKWEVLPDHGRTSSAITPFPVTAATQTPGNKDCPMVSYDVNVFTTGKVKLATYLSPSLDFQNTGGLKFAVSIDDEKPQIININNDKRQFAVDKTLADNINIQYSYHDILTPGKHTIKIWMVDAGVVIQRLVLSPEKYREETYLGPKQSTFVK